MRKKLKFVLVIIFILALLLIVGLLNSNLKFWKQRIASKIVSKQKVVLNLQLEPVGEDKYQVDLNLEDSNGSKIREAFITIYDSNNWSTVYSFSILRTNKDGHCSFELEEGEYDFIISSSETSESLLNEKPFSFFVPVSTQEKTVRKEIPFRRVKVSFEGFPDIYKYKIETRHKRSNGYYSLSQMISASLEEREAEILLSPGKYVLNFDTVKFNPDDLKAFVLTTKDFRPETDGNIHFEFSQLNKFKAKIANTKTGWIKFIVDKGYPDSQALFLDKPINVYTNNESLFIDRVYVGLDQCLSKAEDSLNFKSRSKKLSVATQYNCKNTDFSYWFLTDSKYKNTLIDRQSWQNKRIEVHPPNRLELSVEKDEIIQGNDFRVTYRILNDQDYELIQIGVHQIWDTDVLPKFKLFRKGRIISEFDLWSEDAFKNRKIQGFDKKICLKPGDYTLRGELPTGTWGNNKLLKDEVKFRVQPGLPCHREMADSILDLSTLHYETWEQLYADRNYIFNNSEGYLLTFPSYKKKGVDGEDLLKDYEENTISQCEDFSEFQLQDEKNIGIRLTEENTLNPDKHKYFSQCLKAFSRSNGSKNYILINSLPDLFFSTNQIFMYYHYYLLLHQNPETQVGIVIDQFDKFFYNFSDFFVYNPEHKPYLLSKDELYDWLNSYDRLINDKIQIIFEKK